MQSRDAEEEEVAFPPQAVQCLLGLCPMPSVCCGLLWREGFFLLRGQRIRQ